MMPAQTVTRLARRAVRRRRAPIGSCAACGETLREGDGVVRYRGELWHARSCAAQRP